ncbi:hypothetical protein AXG93_2947s1060 [Marchantia polymorpha subsp. ruderalis]|uniref:Uncharacterized protein n=1 Tax=Marchantia polymorpha subsp. ruderalis TaxID=1480154 RepID=A0A176WQ10_MARPO|nr:hypothetical protein AXG93_2947s1060 [Marchantia polymorpha subsp. ruderalis]
MSSPSSRRAVAECAENLQELNGQVNSAADGSAQSAADWAARISKQDIGSEAQFPPMGMELGVPGHGPRVAAGEEPTSARFPTTSGEVAVRAGEAGPPGARSPTPLEMLAGSGAAIAAEEAVQPSSKELSRISVATEILNIEYGTGSEEEEVESVQGTPTGVLCEQVMPLLRYLDRKATRYADPRHRRSYVKLVRNRTWITK